jgi:hypothetical protein
MTTPARPTPKVNVAALVTEIVEEARKNAEEPAPSKSRVIPSYVAAGLVFALCAWAWVAPPAWLVPRPIAAPSRNYREASTRVALALHAQRVEAFRSSHGYLPRSKQDVGIASDQIVYQVTDSVTFQLSASVDGETVTYKSSQPRDRYLAEAMTALTRARR